MKIRDVLVLLALTLACNVYAETCSVLVKLKPKPIESRTGVILWKSNWNNTANREQTVAEGNHSQKGAAFLIDYKQKKYIRNKSLLDIRDVHCKVVARIGRYPRCTSLGCGTWERWYLRASGSSNISVPTLAKKLGGPTAYIQMANSQWAVIQNVFDNREAK